MTHLDVLEDRLDVLNRVYKIRKAERERGGHCDSFETVEWVAAERERVKERIRQLRRYRRPAGRIASLLNVWLGPLPQDVQYVDPELQSETKGQWSRRLLAFLTLAGAMTMVLTLAQLFPWLLISPLTLTMDATTWLLGDGWLRTLTTIVISYFLLRFLITARVQRSPYREKPLNRLAMEEELHFRTGAESWSVGRRVYSCAAFGLLHVTNIIYPVATLIVVGGAGVVFMVVYLHEYRRTGCAQRATLASARFHATYNRFALVLLAVWIVAYVAVTL